jgi:hypothetical protein
MTVNSEIKSVVVNDCLTGTPPGGESPARSCPASPGDMAAAERVRDLKDRWMVLFLLDTAALREDEIVLLDMDAIEFTYCERPDGVIETVGRGTVPSPETGVPREFFLSARTVEALSQYRSSQHLEDVKQVGFTTWGGRLRLLKLISMMIREWCYRLIVERLRLTEFPRSLARHLFG